jgi:hypothetical protein
MSWREPYFALGVCFLWIGAGAIYFVTSSKSSGKEILLTARPQIT